MSKTFDHASRADAQSIDPMYLCISGGADLPEDERGPLDTPTDPTHHLYAHDLLRPLAQIDVDSVFEHGVLVPITVERGPHDVPMVVFGRGRVRRARKANIRRKAEGLPLIMVKFIVERPTSGPMAGLTTLSRMIDENLRRKSVDLLDQIALAKQLLLAGASEESAAIKIGIPQSRFKEVLAFEDHASPKTKEALRQGRLTPSAGFVLAGLTDHAKQDEKLAELLATPNPTVRAAKQIVDGGGGKPGAKAPRRPEQKKILSRLNACQRQAKDDLWLQGARAALRWATEGVMAEDLSKFLEQQGGEEDVAPKKRGKKKA